MSSRLIPRKTANDRWGDIKCGQARIIVKVEARACPLRQVQKTHGGVGVLPYLPPEQRATFPASEDVTAVTGYSSSAPLFFGRPARRSGSVSRSIVAVSNMHSIAVSGLLGR